MALGGESAPTVGRDTMFAVLMIVLNGVIGLCLLSGGLRHHEQAYNLQGAVAHLAVIIPLSAIALILPNFTRAFPAGSLTLTQAAFFSLFTVLLYGIFLAIQTRRPTVALLITTTIFLALMKSSDRLHETLLDAHFGACAKISA